MHGSGLGEMALCGIDLDLRGVVVLAVQYVFVAVILSSSEMLPPQATAKEGMFT